MSAQINIAINGFGRIGRIAFRHAIKKEHVKIVAINDLIPHQQLAHLLKYDSVHGRFNGEVAIENEKLIVNEQSIRLTSEKDPSKLAWDAVDADIILECTGHFKTQEQASAHLRAGAKKVVISAPSKDAVMYVMGVNHKTIKADENIISNASCTTNCLAILANVVHEHFGIEQALMSTIHSVTASQFTVDAPSPKNYRIGRSALNNIIPTTTGAAMAVTKVIPKLKGKLSGMAFRVPSTDVSVVDLTLKTKQKTNLEAIKKTIKNVSENKLRGILAYTEEELVSQDFVSDSHSCIFDAGASMELDADFFKLVAWYDNEYGYASKLVDLALYIASLKT